MSAMVFSLAQQMEIIAEQGLDAKVAAFEEFVRRTNMPESFEGVVMGKPTDPSDDFITLTRFEVDLRQRANAKVPCSICSPRKGKFYRVGFLIFHIASGEFRIVGATCCKKELDGWTEQLALLAARSREVERRDFVKKNATKAIQMRETLAELLECAQAYDQLRRVIRRQVPLIWGSICEAAKHTPANLSVVEHSKRRRLDLNTGEYVFEHSERTIKIAELYGSEIAQYPFKPLGLIREASQILKEYCPAKAETLLTQPIDQHSANYIDRWTRAEGLMREANDLLSNVRSFFTDHNFKGLKEWGNHPESRVRFRCYVLSKSYTFTEMVSHKTAEIERSQVDRIQLPILPTLLRN